MLREEGDSRYRRLREVVRERVDTYLDLPWKRRPPTTAGPSPYKETTRI